jgi:hypothetical protein
MSDEGCDRIDTPPGVEVDPRGAPTAADASGASYGESTSANSENFIKNSAPPHPSTAEEIPEKNSEKILSEKNLVEDLATVTRDPYRFVLYAFPWGQPGTELEKYPGPDEWQTAFLKDLSSKLASPQEAIQAATASGHGIGKSACVAWLILWAMSTCEDTKCVVTANTETQLKTKTWAELAKWHRLFIAKHWFTFTATALYSVDPDHQQTWRADMIAWSERNAEAFAGLHNQGKRILLIMDEASAIPDIIWETAEAALTDKDTEILWLVFGNPTRGSGRFFDCFNRFRHRWLTRHVDSRTARMTDKTQLDKWISDYGEDSDFCRVRVRGVFPNTSELQFIPGSYVEEARGKHLREDQYNFAPVILTLDNAWSGGDEIVFTLRQGLMAKILSVLKKNDDDIKIAGLLARWEDEYRADAVLIDLGYGTGVYSAGKQMHRQWTLVPFGGASPDPGFVNLRAHMWNQMKLWLKEGGSIPNDPELCAELTGPEAYVVATGHNAGKIYLESKDEMKRRGLPSPNKADGLALSFAVPVRKKDQAGRKSFGHQASDYNPLAPTGAKSEYNPLALAQHDVLRPTGDYHGV